MKMSSCRAGLEGSPVAQHRPQNVDSPARQRDQSLGVFLSLAPLSVVEGPGLGRTTQAGERRLVEDPLEDLVAPTHSAVVSGAFAGVVGGRHQPGISGKAVRALEGTQTSCLHQELRPEDRTHARQASEDPSLGTGEKTLVEFPIESAETLLEGEHLPSEFCGDPTGDVFCWKANAALSFRRSEGLPSDLLGSLDAAVLEEGSEAREA